MIDDIEDDYPEYLADEYGYRWDVWDVLPAHEIRRHDAIARATAEELDEADPAGLDDLDRWAYALARLRHGDRDGFLDAARLVIASNEPHRGIEYSDVYVVTVREMIRAEQLDEAKLHLAQMRDRWPDDFRLDQLGVVLAAQWDPEELRDELSEVLERRSDDPEFLFEVAEDLHQLGRTELCGEVLDAVEAAAVRLDSTAVLVDVGLMREKLTA